MRPMNHAREYMLLVLRQLYVEKVRQQGRVK
jgi:hypothetical protein